MEHILICGVNWIGDGIMSMPALQALRTARSDARIVMLVKPRVQKLWELHGAPDEVWTLDEGGGTWRAAARIREAGFDRAYVLPNSFRSALVPFLGRVPKRIGTAGHARAWMLTEVVSHDSAGDRVHQAYEYYSLFGLPAPEGPLEAKLDLPRGLVETCSRWVADLPRPLVGLIPGAARGPAKQWPEEHFVELGRRLTAERGCGLVVFGSPGERALGGRITAAIGASARNLAGQTGLEEWAAVLKTCDAVAANDSGGMHLSAAVGTPVVAMYGMTDPARTGPLGTRCVVIQKSDVRARDIARDSEAARASLAAITPDEVFDEVVRITGGS